MQNLIRKRVLDYFRYHHWNSHPADGNHALYIEVLEMLEDIGGKRLGEAGMENSWKEIKSIIANCTKEQLEGLAQRIVKLRGEKKLNK